MSCVWVASRWFFWLTTIPSFRTLTPRARIYGPSMNLVPWSLKGTAYRRLLCMMRGRTPGYTPTSVLRRAADGVQTMSRRIDRISVSHSLPGYASSMFTTPVGFSDHNSVVLQFVGMGLDGKQPTRWKFPLDALQDPDTVDWVSRELQTLEEEGVQGLEAFQRSQVVLQDAARRYNANAPVATPAYL